VRFRDPHNKHVETRLVTAGEDCLVFLEAVADLLLTQMHLICPRKSFLCNIITYVLLKRFLIGRGTL
jgi:hypothetical protein